MTPLDSQPIAAPKPAQYLYDENGQTTCWLASAYSPRDIRDEWDYLFENGAKLHEIWFSVRWTTPEELSDEDWLYYQFGDVEMNNVNTSTVYTHVKADTPGAHRYWTTEL